MGQKRLVTNLDASTGDTDESLGDWWSIYLSAVTVYNDSEHSELRLRQSRPRPLRVAAFRSMQCEREASTSLVVRPHNSPANRNVWTTRRSYDSENQVVLNQHKEANYWLLKCTVFKGNGESPDLHSVYHQLSPVLGDCDLSVCERQNVCHH